MIHQLELDWRQEPRNLFHHQPSFEGIVVYQLIDLFRSYQFTALRNDYVIELDYGNKLKT